MLARLSGMDAGSLHSQSSTMPAHTVALITLEESDQLSHQRLHQLVGSSLPQLARFRSRLVGKPLGFGQPVWAEIDDYDPTSQIHSATVRAPGGRREFADLIARLTTGRQDCREPLWEAWSIDGLAGGRWALAVKMSPSLSDGVAGTGSIWPRLLNTDRQGHPTSYLPSQPSLGLRPSPGRLVTDMMVELVENQFTGVWLIAEAVTGVLEAVRRRLRGTAEPDPIPPAGSSMSGPVPHTVFDAPLTQRRAVAFASIPLADLKTVNNAFGGSISNVFLAACTLSLRSWLQSHDTVPDEPLLMQMPLSLPIDDPTTSGDSFTVGRIRIPVQLDDPVQVLTHLHTATERLNTARIRDDENPGRTVDFAAITSLIPPPIARAGMQLFTGLGLWQRLAPICHGTLSYVSGKTMPAYCAGAEVVGMYSAAPLEDGCGLNIALTSYGDVMDLSVCVCPDNVPAVNEIATGIAESVGILVAAAKQSPRGQGRSVVTEITSQAAKRSHARHY
jgi:diacylglycerol O-acyltransferase / wax synthase